MAEAKAEKKRTCFVIAPIGPKDSEIRDHSDKVMRHIIEPAAAERGYKAERADQMPKPGIITSQVIKRLREDDVVIADLTGHNPNVFYELAIRHAVGKPTVQMMASGKSLPFDVEQSRTIFFDLTDPDSVVQAKKDLMRHIRALEENPSDFDNPVSAAIDLERLRGSEKPEEQWTAEILERLQDIHSVLTGGGLGERKAGRTVDLTTAGMQLRAIDDLASRALATIGSEAEGVPAKGELEAVRILLQSMRPSLRDLCGALGLDPEQIFFVF